MPVQDPTTNYAWALPDEGGDVGAWGGMLRSIIGDDATGIDAIIKGVSNVANAALPKAGGTMTGNLLATDNLYDIGASGATRFRDLWLSRNASIGGTLGVTGAVTLSSTLAVTGAGTFGAATDPVKLGHTGTYGIITFNGLQTTNTSMGIFARVNGAEGLYYNTPTGTNHEFTINGALVALIASGGQVLIGTTVSAGAAAGELVLANNKGIRAVNGAGNNTLELLRLTTANAVALNLNGARWEIISHLNAGAAGALAGYIVCEIGGVERKIPYYATA